jgi:hypothetical protein
MLVKPWIALAVTSGLMAALLRQLSLRRRTRTEKLQLREDMNRWEQEGGHLPPR